MGKISAAHEDGDAPPGDPAGTPFDTLAFAARYDARLRQRARRIVGPRGGDPDDVLHEVYLRLLKRTGIRTDADALAFCVTNMRWIALDNVADSARSVPHADVPHAGEKALDPADIVAGRAFLDLVHSILSPQQRLVWTAVEVAGHTPQEVAEQLGMAPAAVRATLYRAWQRLRGRADKFRSLVAGTILAPMRRRGPSLVRPEPGWVVASGALAGLSLLVGSSGLVPPRAQAQPPGVERHDPSSPHPTAATRVLGSVRERSLALPGRRGAASSAGPDDAALPSARKLGGCVAGVCVSEPGDSRDRHGHGIWIVGGGPAPQSNEVYTDQVPLCAVVDPALAAAPEPDGGELDVRVGCERYGSAGPLVKERRS